MLFPPKDDPGAYFSLFLLDRPVGQVEDAFNAGVETLQLEQTKPIFRWKKMKCGR
jgi:hypothetical protein